VLALLTKENQMNTDQIVEHMKLVGSLTALKLIISAGIQMEVMAENLLTDDDKFYSGQFKEDTAAAFHGCSTMLHELVEQFGDILQLLEVVVPDHMIAVKVDNPLYQAPQTTDDSGESSVRGDDLPAHPF